MNVRIFRVRAIECMCAQTRPRFILSSVRVFSWDGVRTHVNSKGKILSTGKILPRGGLNPRRCIKQDSEPNTLLRIYAGLTPCTILLLLLLCSRPCQIFSSASKAKSAVWRSVSTGPQSFLWASTGLGHVWRLK